MKIRTRWIFTIILCLLIAIPLAACDGLPATPSGTLESQNGVTVEGRFADGAALEAVEVVGEDKILALQSIAEEKYDTDGEVYVYDISVVKDGAKVQLSGKVKVTVSVPDIDTSKTYTVYHVKGDSGENATTYYCGVEYNGLNYRGVYIKASRKDNDNTQTTSSRYWTGTYWFEQRDAMWQIVKEEDGKAYLVSKEIWISQRFAESDEGELTYENSWIRNWLINTWINELFTPAQQAILQGNEACFGDKIFLPSSDEISINNPKPFGLCRYPFCLGAYKEVLQGYGDNYCPYWLRDGIVKGADGKNYVTCVTSRPPFDQTTQYLATKTFVGVVPAIIIEL